MAYHATFFGLALSIWTTVSAWPAMQNPNQPQNSWQWANNEGEKTFEMPKSMAYPIPGGQFPNFDGSEGSNPKSHPGQQLQQQQKSNQFFQQGPASEPWSNFQSNNPFGSNGPFDLSSQEPSPFDSSFNGVNVNDEFPYTRPYRNNLFPQNQYPSRAVGPESMYNTQEPPPPFHMSPNGPGGPTPQRGGPMMGNGQQQYQMPPPPPPPPPPNQRQHPFGHMMGQNRPFDWTRISGRSNSPEMAPSSAPFDFLSPRYPIEYSPSKSNNGSVSAITVNYNVTYTFTPWGWKMIDVSVSNASFHTSASQKAVELVMPGGGIMPQNNEANKNSDNLMTPGWWWGPKKGGSELDGKTANGNGKPGDGVEPIGFGDASIFPRATPPQ